MRKFFLTLLFLLAASNFAATQEPPIQTGGNPGAVNRNYTEQIRKRIIERDFIETVPEDLDAEKKRREEEERRRSIQRGQVTFNPEFRLNDIEFQGNTIYDSEKLKALSEDLIGKDIYFADVVDYALLVSRYYQKNGYLTTYAYIPPQEINNGVVTIVISESKIVEKNVTGNRWARTFFIKRIATGGTPFQKLSIGKVFNIKPLQGAIKTINREAYMSTTASIEKDQADNTILDFEMKDRFPLRSSFAWDDFGRDHIGRQRFSALLGSDNLTGFGDRIYGGPILAQHSQAAVAGYQIPLSEYGTTLAFDYSYARVMPGGPFAPLKLVGTSKFFSLTLRQMLINNSTTDFSAYAAFDWISAKTDLTSVQERLTDYTLRIPRVGLDLFHDDRRGRWISNVEASFGIDGLGSSGNVAGGPQTSFQKFTGSLIRVERLPWDILGIVRVNGQYSPQSLFSAEQMYIGGPYNIWGFQPSELLGDWGIAGGAELRIPIPYLKKTLPEKIKFVADRIRVLTFYHWGLVLQQSNVSDNPQNFIHSTGFGFYINVSEQLSALFGVGYPIGNRFFDQTGSRMFFTINADLDRFMKPIYHPPKEKVGVRDNSIKKQPLSSRPFYSPFQSALTNSPIRPISSGPR